MTAVDRLVVNGNTIIGFFKRFSSATAQDVTFTWIEDDDSETEITYQNIKKYQDTLQNDFQNFKDDINTLLSSDDTALDTLQEMVDSIKDTKTKTEANTNDITANDAYVRIRSERADYCRRIENALMMSKSATYSTDKYLKWDNRLIAIGVGSDTSVYGVSGHFSVHVPATDTVIKGHSNVGDITVTDAGIKMEKWGSLYCEIEDNQSSDSKDANWHYVGYDSASGVMPENWILIASCNNDTETVRIAGQVLTTGRTIYPETCSDPVLGTDLQNVGGVIKDSANNIMIGKPIPIKRLGDVLINGFENNWAEYGNDWQCNISKDGFGIVVITGLVKDGDSGTDIGSLPDEYKPLGNRFLTIQQCSSEEYERFDVMEDGDIHCGTDGTRSGTNWMSINITYQARVEV